MIEAAPSVSIITATYNRSNVLRYTIASVLRSTYGDWEMLVIGDACTDDTAEVVASFGDARIRFINLEENSGEQSGPNNEGLRRARGRYIAFLNHDDLWMANHLEVAVRHLEETGADLVYALAIAIVHQGKPGLRGGTRGGEYGPQVNVPASQWLFRRELPTEIGLWRFSREIHATPSQDWLFRAWIAGKKIREIPQVTVLAIQSGIRHGSYARRDYLENEEYYERMVRDPHFLEPLITQVAVDSTAQLLELAIGPNLRRIGRNLLYRLGLLFRVPPEEIHHFLGFGRKGGLVAHFREVRGLPRYAKRSKEDG